MAKPTYTIQGKKFRLKPTSPKNINAMRDHFDNPSEELENMDQYEQYIELLRVITEPVSGNESDYDEIDVMDLDLKEVENILANFLPNLMRISSVLNAS